MASVSSVSDSAALTVDGITTNYGKHLILEDVSLTVTPGEVFGLIGLNGVGKTTLIKSILTLVKPAVGTVRIFGEDHKRPVSRAKLAYLPEKFQPPPLLTGTEFVRFSLSYYGVKFDRAAASEMANNLGLEDDALDKRVGVYSKGMSQKLGLLATFMTELPLLMLDEPMSGLDPKARILLKRQVEAYHSRGNTVFLSSHILADLDEMCDRVGVLHDGRLAYDGTPAALKEREGSPSLERAFLGVIEGVS
jgi:ABC-2 type transport system ATP-binding protein